MLVPEAHQALVACRLAAFPLVITVLVEMATPERLARYTRQRVRLLHQPPQNAGTAFRSFEEQDRSVGAHADALRT